MSKYRWMLAGIAACTTALLAPATLAQPKPVMDYKSAAEVPVAQFFGWRTSGTCVCPPTGRASRQWHRTRAAAT